jgi:hypothetical protein
VSDLRREKIGEIKSRLADELTLRERQDLYAMSAPDLDLVLTLVKRAYRARKKDDDGKLISSFFDGDR